MATKKPPPTYGRRQTDAVNVSKLTLPIHFVVPIIVVVLAVAGAVWAMESGSRSDLRDLSTQIAGQMETAKVQRQLDDERLARQAEKQQLALDALKATVETIQREQRLMQIEFQNFRESVLSMQGRAR